MKLNVDFPTHMYVNTHTLRFAFEEEVSQENLWLVRSFTIFLQTHYASQIREIVPSYHTVTVFLQGTTLPVQQMPQYWAEWQMIRHDEQVDIITIPVCYDEEFALDIERIMTYTKLSYEVIIKLHSSHVYDVFMMGFLPGFPYLGVLDERLHMPRLEVPRKHVVAGTVGIGGEQTGIYPIDSPGGWNIIGRTPIALFHPKRTPHFLIKPNQQVKLERITKKEYENLLRKEL